MSQRDYNKFGHYRINANPIGKVGILYYTPQEVGIQSNKELLSVYRSKEQTEEALGTLDGIPITVGHTMLCGEKSEVEYSCQLSENIKIVGSVIGNGYIEGDVIYADLLLYQEPKDSFEFSIGADSEILYQGGETESGKKYDIIQVLKTFNHLALVPKGRAGREVKILDEEGKSMEEEKGGSVEEKLDALIEAVNVLSEAINRLTTKETEEAISEDEKPKEEPTPEQKAEDTGEFVNNAIQKVLKQIKLKEEAYQIGSKHVGAFNAVTMDTGEVISYVANKLKIPNTIEALRAFDIGVGEKTKETPVMDGAKEQHINMCHFFN